MSPIGSVEVDPVEISVSYFDDVMFNCSGQGGPDNQFEWIFLSNGDTVSNSSELLLEEVSLDEKGQYQCVVTNDAGNDSAIAFLNGMNKIMYFT